MKPQLKSAVIFFHKNIQSLYKPKWINKCISSIKSQTYQDFDVFELDYSGNNIKLCDSFIDNKYSFESIEFENHIYAMNYLIDKLFKNGYDVIFNTNMDDYYHIERFSKQIEKIKEGYDLVSSNFIYLKEDEYLNDIVTKHLDMFSTGDIKTQLDKNHNIIAHPCICMSKSFWDDNLKYNNLLGYEDLDLWQRGINKGKKFYIINEYLLYYRLHDKQVTKTYNGK